MKPDPKDLIFVGTIGHLRAIDKRTGEDVWETSLPSTGYDLVSLICEPGVLYAASKGYVFALDPTNGNILWTNTLKWLGTEHVTLATLGTPASPILPSAKVDADRARAESKSTLDSILDRIKGG